MKSRKIRTFIPEDTSVYANPYISFPAERNIDNTKSSFELRYNKNYKVNSKRVFTISSEYRDIDRAIKPDLLHPSTLDRILTMENQDGTTVCADLLNQTDKKYQHKRSKPKKHYYAVTKTATIAADIGIPTSEEAKVAKVLATSPMQLEKMLFKDYYGTRVGRKNSPPELHMIYNFDNWLQVRVCKEDPDKVVGRTIYYYNPSEMRPLEMNAFAKTIWTQKSVYVPVRFGTDVVPLQPSSSSTAIAPAPVDINASLQDWQKGFENKIFGRLNEWSSQYQQAQQAQQPVKSPDIITDDYDVNFPESINVSYNPSRKGSVTGVTGYIDLKVKNIRGILHKIWVSRSESFASRADKFIDLAKECDWDFAKMEKKSPNLRKNLTTEEKENLKYLCSPYYREHDKKWWEYVKTGADIRKPEKTEAEPIPKIQQNDADQQAQPTVPTVPTGIAVPPQNETVSLDQQQPAQPVQQPVQQQVQTPEQAQPAQSVFTDQQQPAAQQEQDGHVEQDEQTSNENNQQNVQGIAFNMMGFIRTELLKQDKFKNILNDLLLNKYKQYYKGDANLSVFYLFDNAFKSKNYQPVISVFSDYVNNLENTEFKQVYLKNLVTQLKDYLTRVQQA